MFPAFGRLPAEVEMEGTFSIVARGPATGELGAAGQSKAFATESGGGNSLNVVGVSHLR